MSILLEKVPIRLVPDLYVTALQQKQDKDLALWFCLRQLNVTGSCSISLEVAIDDLLRIFGFSRQSAQHNYTRALPFEFSLTTTTNRRRSDYDQD